MESDIAFLKRNKMPKKAEKTKVGMGKKVSKI